MKNLKMFCPVYGIPIQKCVTFARRLGPVFTAILSALALAEKSPGHICTHLPKGVAPPPRVAPIYFTQRDTRFKVIRGRMIKIIEAENYFTTRT